MFATYGLPNTVAGVRYGPPFVLAEFKQLIDANDPYFHPTSHLQMELMKI